MMKRTSAGAAGGARLSGMPPPRSLPQPSQRMSQQPPQRMSQRTSRQRSAVYQDREMSLTDIVANLQDLSPEFAEYKVADLKRPDDPQKILGLYKKLYEYITGKELGFVTDAERERHLLSCPAGLHDLQVGPHQMFTIKCSIDLTKVVRDVSEAAAQHGAGGLPDRPDQQLCVTVLDLKAPNVKKLKEVLSVLVMFATYKHEMQGEFNELRQQCLTEFSTMKEQLDSQRSERDELEAQQAEDQRELDAARDRLASLRRTDEELDARVSQLQRDGGEAVAAHGRLAHDVEGKETRLAELVRECEQLDEEIADSPVSLASVHEDCEKKEAKEEELANRCVEVADAISVRQAMIVEQQQIHSVLQDLVQLISVIDSNPAVGGGGDPEQQLQEQIALGKETLQQVQGSCETLQSEIKALQESHAWLNSELTRRRQDTECKLDAVTRERSDIQRRRECSESHLVEVRREEREVMRVMKEEGGQHRANVGKVRTDRNTIIRKYTEVMQQLSAHIRHHHDTLEQRHSQFMSGERENQRGLQHLLSEIRAFTDHCRREGLDSDVTPKE